MNVRLFISHSSKDKPLVEQLALALTERGIDVWLDKWEISPGDDIVARINEGLATATAGTIVLSRHSRESGWVTAEQDSMFFARVEDGKVLIPVVTGPGEQARQTFLNALDIAQRLAQAEPDRADYQRDLVISLVKVGTIDPAHAEERFGRALAILHILKDSGRLAPIDEPMIPEVERLLAEFKSE